MNSKPPYRGDEVFIRGNSSLRILPVLLLIVFLVLPSSADADWSLLVDRLVSDGFDPSEVAALFSRPEVRFEPGAMSNKIDELMKRACRKPAALPSYNSKAVHKGFLRDKVIARTRSYLRDNMDLLEQISTDYCVPKEIVVAILLVETRLGEFLGGRGAFNSLASMALCTDLGTIRPYLPRRLINPKNEDYARTICSEKAEWAYAELKALILYGYLNGFDPVSLPGSIYGAIGLCQFMPSNVSSYGVDADNDGRIDLFTKADALASIANYLSKHGWRCTMAKADQFGVILDYNRSYTYANTVLAVAEKIKDKSRIKK